MNEIEKTVRDWIREIGRTKTREVCIEVDQILNDREIDDRIRAECEELTNEQIQEVLSAVRNRWMKAFNKVTHNNTKEV